MARQLRPCAVTDCSGSYGVPGSARGYCVKHYQRWKAHGDPNATARRRSVCDVDECEKFVSAHGYCVKHYTRLLRHGDPVARLRGEVVAGCRICPGCGVDKPLADYSSATGRCRRCKAEDTRTRRSVKPAPASETWPCTCDRCGVTFMGNKRRWRYCTRECFSANKNAANWKHYALRRSRKAAALVESFDRREIFERDGWICKLCDTPVDRDAQWPDPLMASLDHIVPLARGGEHSRANAQTTHLGCNVRKGAKLPAA